MPVPSAGPHTLEEKHWALGMSSLGTLTLPVGQGSPLRGQVIHKGKIHEAGTMEGTEGSITPQREKGMRCCDKGGATQAKVSGYSCSKFSE